MKVIDVLRKALAGRGTAAASAARNVDEKLAAEAVKAWGRPGGPVDPGFSA